MDKTVYVNIKFLHDVVYQKLLKIGQRFTCGFVQETKVAQMFWDSVYNCQRMMALRHGWLMSGLVLVVGYLVVFVDLALKT